MPALGQELHLVFYNLESDSYVVRSGVVTGVRGAQVQLEGMKGWHETEMWPPAFGSEDEALEWIGEHPFTAGPKNK